MKRKFLLMTFIMSFISTISIAFPADTLYCTNRDKEIFNDYCKYIEDVYQKCKSQIGLPKELYVNYVKEIYNNFTDEQISSKIAEMVKSKDIKAEVLVVFQKIDNLHLACPENSGDWYFSGNYPTPGGNKVVNTAFINWREGRDERSY